MTGTHADFQVQVTQAGDRVAVYINGHPLTEVNIDSFEHRTALGDMLVREIRARLEGP